MEPPSWRGRGVVVRLSSRLLFYTPDSRAPTVGIIGSALPRGPGFPLRRSHICMLGTTKGKRRRIRFRRDGRRWDAAG